MFWGAALAVAVLGAGCSHDDTEPTSCSRDPHSGATTYFDYRTHECTIPVDHNDSLRLYSYRVLRGVEPTSIVRARIELVEEIAAPEAAALGRFVPASRMVGLAVRLPDLDEGWEVQMDIAHLDISLRDLADAPVMRAVSTEIESSVVLDEVTTSTRVGQRWLTGSLVVEAPAEELVQLLHQAPQVRAVVQVGGFSWRSE